MRLHRLEVTAFGPFAGTETVDFDALSDEGLHLIQGPTGAGKSSILDAVCFALFASVPRHRAGKGALHSDHATPGSVPQVVLEFTAGGRRLRLSRSPEFSRPKKRGTGETREQHRVLLQEWTRGQWVAKGTRADEVGQVIDDVVGLGLEQFMKVVLLPQGEFAAFLRATPEDRRGLLERLFDTSRFSDVEQWLARRRRDSGEDLARIRERLDRHLQRVDDELAGLGVLDAANGSDTNRDDADGSWPVWSQIGIDEVEPELTRARKRVDELATRALVETEAAEAAFDTASRTAEQGRRTATLQREGRSARAELDAVNARASHVARQRQRLERALRAGQVRPHLDAVDRACDDQDRLAREAATARVAAAGHCGEVRVPEQVTAADARSLADSVRDATATLVRAREALHRGETARVEGRESRKQADRITGEVEELRVARHRADAERASTEARVAELADTAARQDARQHEVRRLERAHRLRQQLEDDEQRLSALSVESEACTRAWREAEEHVLALRRARLDDIAGELGEQLEDGSACPVCGSREHPRPAGRALTDVDTSDAGVGAAEELAGSARVRHEEAQRALTTARARRDGQADALHEALAATEGSPRLELEELPAALTEARLQLTAAADAARQLPEVRSGLDALVETAEQAALRMNTLHEERAAARSRAETAEADEQAQQQLLEQLLSTHASECACGRDTSGDPDAEGEVDEGADKLSATHRRWDVDEVAAAHQRAREGLDALATLLRDRDAAAARLATAREQRDRALHEQDFTSPEQAREAALPEAEVVAVQQEVDDHARRRVTAQAQLDRPEVGAALTADEPDLDALTVVLQQARERQRTAHQADSHHGRAVKALARLAGELHETLGRLGPAEAEHQLLAELADCVAGTSQDNTLRMRLSSYVLAARLEEVARYANERLAVMSEGRYSLQHSDAKAARGARGGLGLTVTDAWTGVARDTVSLSGGESFMAALSLALGLGDAVRAEAGGLDLQTLFIDEGFGSLDEESLEQVIGVLDDLREGGRTIGVVSHVAELRQRIRTQVLVSKTTAGSHIALNRSVDDEPAA